MANPVYNPRIPLCDPISGGPLVPGRMLRIQGSSPTNASRFAVNLQVGPNVNPRDDLALHLNVRFDENQIVLNSLSYQSWGEEERHPGYMPLTRGTPFELLILSDPAEFKVAINSQHYCGFRHRMPPQSAPFLSIDGDVVVTLIGVEGGGAPVHSYAGVPAAPQQPPQPYGMPQPGGYNPYSTASAPGGYGAPQPQPAGYGMPQPSPAGMYGAPQPAGYGPPPPPYNASNQYQPHSGGGGLMGKVGAVATGAMGAMGLHGLASSGSSAMYPGHKKHKKMKKSKLAKYGVPVAAGLGGAYMLSKASHGLGIGGFGHCGSGSSSSSSSSSDE